ncbi:hypothetical protein BDV96DRAFT_580311 [Lophiotrema nucula]|uniref:Midasin n=1 Tax=Lophiotrema nucula TaxID=690887 RepID=A0A6A5Z2V5_9PLEO|nr:hypothetical protein BDV96DRAFT_580311 [Lophiotrema nucula]
MPGSRVYNMADTLPDEVAAITNEFLESTDPDRIFLEYEAYFTEYASRWIDSPSNFEAKVAAFARILPFAPHLAEHAEKHLSSISKNNFQSTSGDHLHLYLLGIFRLLSHDCRSFAKHVRPLAIQSLFRHQKRYIRYLAVRIFCIYVHAADFSSQEMLKSHVGEGEIMGNWEGRTIDYRFLSLWEEKRWNDLGSKLKVRSVGARYIIPTSSLRNLSASTVQIGGVLLPRLDGTARETPTELVSTSTTEANLRKIALGVLESRPLLLNGLAGSGKTLLARHFASHLNKLETMVTLHLNEQSDAKLLIGMYATGAKPGTFSWRPGVLTTAVKEGRWIFIEDLDRAPNEVISTLLPLIERGELLIPSRGETIRAAPGFRIIASMRTTLNPKGQQILPRQNMIGHRFWNNIIVEMPQLEEFAHIISIRYPSLSEHLGGIMGVFSRLLGLYGDARFASENGTSLRALTPRDLLKWCDRISVLLQSSTTFSSTQVDDIFMEAYDCFAGSLRSEQSRFRVMTSVAEQLHIDPQRKDHLLQSREVKLEAPSKSTTIRIGRARLSKHKSPKKLGTGRPFSTNDYTLRLLEKVAVAVDRQEPLLLVGETGTGKTTSIQYLTDQLGRKLVAFNLSQQSESGDLLGGYKPVNVRSLVIPLKDEFDDLFDTTFSKKRNARFLEMLGKRVAKGEWKRVCMLWREALKMVAAAQSQTSSPDPDGEQPKKKRKVDSLPARFPKARWEKFAADISDLEAQLANGSQAFAFSFLEGNIVKAVRNGDWVLLDEINLASSDTLEALADLLGGGPDGKPSILLTETGSVERVVAHPNFRVFAAMNPATDVGKKDLPPGIRSRFTELYVESPDSDVKSLRNIVEKYLGGEANDPAVMKIALHVTNLYLEIQRLSKSNMLVDGADQKPHFSLRTLTRALTYAREIAPLCTLRRALYEGFQMSFITFLNKASEEVVAPLIKQHLFPEKSTMKAELGKSLQQPQDGRSYVRQGHYWLRQGAFNVEDQPHYIITPFVQRNMNNLIRASSTRRYPVLIQGPTSSGKTSMIEYLAKRSGNKFVRINNHEHTDLQEYLGSYVSGNDGKLQFQEGILVRALREGHWIVLDELNLAPTDVLEALNRLLDDNRELLIPETQEVVRPHEDFMLFATQNPAGLYGGRKVLSRAFRNRFLELHFDDIPVEELTEILHRRTTIPESWCKRIVKVYQELSTLRQENRLFEQKSFATLRDLFRWAQRKADTIQDLATNGYMLLAERVRKEEERKAVKNVVETVLSKNGPRVSINEDLLYSESTSLEIKSFNEKTYDHADVVWTRAMRRLFVLVAHALRNNEPVLLVGETGCGKTTVCQMLADAFEKQLHILNAHQNTETGDLIGAQRPIRNRAAIEDLLCRQLVSVLEERIGNVEVLDLNLSQLLEAYDKLDQSVRDAIPADHRNEIQSNRVNASKLFEWADGSLVQAMKTGQLFLLDEISLADDSVLERLNSVLESSRTLLLAEKGPIDSLVTASTGFQFLATMNPGGDYGKKELSPALRNRFTEIWVPSLSDAEDILQIVHSKLRPEASPFAKSLVGFAQWFNARYNTSVSTSISIRDTLAWVTFINNVQNDDPFFGIVHGAAMVYIDTLGANPAGLLAISQASIDEERNACLQEVSRLLNTDVMAYYYGKIDIATTSQTLQLGSFSVPRYAVEASDSAFALEAPTTRSNAMRVARALQLPKPILLEGNPGVGKTTLITALSKATGKPLTRLNLSEQTDLMDLFGSDVPIEGGQAGTFAWRDAPFLRAMKNGDWVLLDEMNLASQSILEGLNAVLDHRGEVYISELDQTFHKHEEFRVFAAQNPHHQGGGRKGLPASFVNRFTVVYADVFRPEDLSLICSKVFPSIEASEITKLISFVAELDKEVVLRRAFGALGSPWEFNLRDTLRWLSLLGLQGHGGTARDFLDTIFIQRFRSAGDRAHLLKLFDSIYGEHEPRISLYHNLAPKAFQVGMGLLGRDFVLARSDTVSPLRVPHLGPIEALMVSVKQNWPVVLVGPPASGKTAMLSQLASFVGADLVTFAMNADIDAMDLVGGYEQVDPSRGVHRFTSHLEQYIRRCIAASKSPAPAYIQLLEILESSLGLVATKAHGLLQTIATGNLEAATLLQEFEQLLRTPAVVEGARFQWVDGILIQALEQGKWLVLDNANLCSSAVLDRLNSLLEPNGYLSINEHSTSDGEAQVVRPHPDFRIFMTMDPRYGELSRAMRNRAVEISLLPETSELKDDIKLPAYPLESQGYRFRHFQGDEDDLEDTLAARFEHLSVADNQMLASFGSEAKKGLVLSTHSTALTNGDHASHVVTELRVDHLSEFLGRTWASKTVQSQAQLATLFQDGELSLLPYHPLTDELVLQRTNQSKSPCLSFASFYELFLDLYEMSRALEALPSLKFERRKEKQKLPAALQGVWRNINAWAEATWNSSSQHSAGPLKSLQILCWALLALAKQTGFDRAAFQTYLQMVKEQISSLQLAQGPFDLAAALSNELSVFSAEVELRTGLGMERIWKHFKPDTPKTLKQLNAVLSLEDLGDRLDAAMWKSSLNADEMIQIQERFASSLQLVKSQDIDATELVTMLGNAVQDIEGRIEDEDAAITPYFAAEFEGLCQFLDILEDGSGIGTVLDPVTIVRAKAALHARRTTKTANSVKSRKPSDLFSSLYNFLGLSNTVAKEMALQGRFHVSLMGKMHGIDEVQLSELDRLETELQVLSQHISLHSHYLTQDQEHALSNGLKAVLSQLYTSHESVFTMDNGDILVNPDAMLPQSYRTQLLGLGGIMQESLSNLESPGFLSRALVHFALTGLTLYVPNYPFDPALRPMIERQLFHQQQATLIKKLQDLRTFQVGFTGQETSFRIRRIEAEIGGMGSEPLVPAIVRPETSELDALQGEFTNMLSVIQPLIDGTLKQPAASQDMTLRQNISRIIQRLKEGYRAYDDITEPAVGFLVCLSIGLALSGQVSNDPPSAAQSSVQYVLEHTPFFGLQLADNVSITEALIGSCERELQQGNNAIDPRWHVLQCLAIVKSVQPSQMSERKTLGLVQNIFSSLYGQWKQKLIQDQEKEAKNSSLYTYRGEEQENDDEDVELFPDYEKEDVDQSLPTSTSREHTIRLANIHAQIFLEPADPAVSMKHLLKWCSAELVRVAEGESQGTKLDGSLPAIFLALKNKSDALSNSGTGKTYNFYFDANIVEAKKLITLVHRIQQRYRQIRKVWPEHATLSEVLRTCDEALAFRHVDPVAKFITKAEKLHGYIHEWQRVASREFNTANLYDDLTSLLVSWRQLELTTWARLFDIETEKCCDDAKSWFFIAYETIVAASEAIQDQQGMQTHAKELLQTLEGFFSTTTLGQFEQRIILLQQFRGHVAMRMQDDNSFKPIHLALSNFIAYFARLTKPVHEALANGRQKLEKEVNNVIKLASWKDTNIEALKQSAKASHRKLSKLVRKFRAILNRPVSGIYAAGFSEQTFAATQVLLASMDANVVETALALCETHISGWGERPTRFRNLNTTLSIMRSKSTISSDAVNGAAYVESFIIDLETSITQLQKATPTTLTDENKEAVQHLKARKRKLYADTMKELRQMGFRSNLSSDVLAKQDGLSTVLATLPTASDDGSDGITKGAEYFLHKSLNIMAQVRGVVREHSGDLTANDVARSIGFLEGVLHSTIQQRKYLSHASRTLADLKDPVDSVAQLCSSDRTNIVRVSTSQVDDVQKITDGIAWLSFALNTCADVLDAQAKLGKTEEFDDVVQGVREWSAEFQRIVTALKDLPALPANIWSDEHTTIQQITVEKMAGFRQAYAEWNDASPLPRATLRHLEPFIFNAPRVNAVTFNDRTCITTEAHVKDVFTSLDLILGAMQDVEAALKNIPTSTEDAAWLAKEEQILNTAISALHASQITEAVQNIVDHIQYLHEDDNLRAIAAMFATIQPILQQYLASHRYLVERYKALHLSTTKLLYRLAKSFIQVGTQGFCTPQEKSSEQQPDKDDKLESGTGLGEGEGAEDISKDIEDDEDLEDLAQEKRDEREGSIEEQDDAVDMGEQEMEGEMGDVADKEDQEGEGEEGDESDAESQVGSVDDLGPSAVDEKMWDEGGKDDDAKDKEGQQDVGTANEDEQVAAEQKEKKGEEGEQQEKQQGEAEDEDEEMEGEDQDENVGVAEKEQMDPHAKEEETLDLPDELNIDGNDEEKEDDDFDDMDMGDEEGEEMDVEPSAQPDTVEEDIGPEQEGEEEKDATGHVQDEEHEPKPEEEGEEPIDDDMIPLPDEQLDANEPRPSDDKDQTDANAEAGAGAGAEANEEVHQDDNKQASANAANQQDGTEGDASERKQEATAEDGTLGQAAQPQAGGQGEDAQESPETQSFKKLGDVLERWYNQQRQIQNASQKDDTQVQQIDKEVDMADAEFEHLQDENDEADTQALGTATEEQAKALDHDMALPVNEEEKIPARPEDKDESLQEGEGDIDMQDAEQEWQENKQKPSTDGQPQAFVGEQKPFQQDEDDQDMADAMPADDDISETSSVQDVETQLELTHLDGETTQISPENARALWLHHESSTHSLSQQLTESLRLILAPTLATKLRGDFRTGKRLNLKRIIPYIASEYKRDKIWLRRSMPSKRNYQVLIALDDSRSMRESGAESLALKTLTLVTRSLSMLEVGEVSVVGFGEDVNVAHEFDKPFTSESGVRVFEQFGFQASKTNVRGLVERSLELFKEARLRGATSAGEDLWQLMLVVSDGICDSHAEIQRLVRRAQEERVMIVFIIIDSTTPPQQPEGTRPASASAVKHEKTSILDLQSVEISPEGKVVRWKYMERFPFRYYLVVRDVRELPGVLAGALRQWFGEVAGSSG